MLYEIVFMFGRLLVLFLLQDVNKVLLKIKLENNALRKKHTPFLCNFRFKNDLPEVGLLLLYFLIFRLPPFSRCRSSASFQ